VTAMTNKYLKSMSLKAAFFHSCQSTRPSRNAANTQVLGCGGTPSRQKTCSANNHNAVHYQIKWPAYKIIKLNRPLLASCNGEMNR
jgi:hypothetical protein